MLESARCVLLKRVRFFKVSGHFAILLKVAETPQNNSVKATEKQLTRNYSRLILIGQDLSQNGHPNGSLYFENW